MLIFDRDNNRLSSDLSIKELKDACRMLRIQWSREAKIDRTSDFLFVMLHNPQWLFTIAPEVVSCTSDEFEREAVRSMGRFKPRNKAELGVSGMKRMAKTVSKRDDFYRSLLQTRVARSEISGERLPEDPKQKWMFSHVLAKGAYPGIEYYKINIVLMTFREHQQWEFEQHKLKDRPEWAWVFLLEEKLKEDYWRLKKGKPCHLLRATG